MLNNEGHIEIFLSFQMSCIHSFIEGYISASQFPSPLSIAMIHHRGLRHPKKHEKPIRMTP